MSDGAQPFSFAPSGVPMTLEAISALRATLPALADSPVVDVLDAHSPAQTDYYLHYGFVELMAAVPHAEYRAGTLNVELSTETERALVVHSWALADARGCVCLFHGLFDHVGLYLPLVESLLLQGLNVLAIDMPGHGLSEGDRAAISTFKEYAPVVDALVTCAGQRYPNLEVMAIGQSTGAAAVMNYQLVAGENSAIRRAVYLAPLIRPYKCTAIRLALRVLGGVLSRFLRGFTVNSHNLDFCDFLKRHDPLQARYLSIPWLKAMMGWVADVEKRLALRRPSAELEVSPLLIVQGTGDKTVDWQTNIQFLQELVPSANIVLVDQALHHLVNEQESYRNPVFEAVAHFLRG